MPRLSRPQLIGVVVLLVVVVFLVGFLPQWQRARGLSAELDATHTELEETREELRWARLEGVLGAALAESLRSNYERSRQLMTRFFSELQGSAATLEDPAQRRELEAILAQRDEIITLLSRAEPESTQRLMLVYTRYFSAMDPVGREAPTAVTPSPPAP